MAWTGEGSDAVVSAGSATGSPGFSFVSTRTGTVFTLIDVGAWSGHQRALKLRASKGMMWTLSLTTGAGARGARTRAFDPMQEVVPIALRAPPFFVVCCR